MAQERLQKIIARAGLASRRKAEVLIREGRVRVNGVIVSTLGAKADSEEDRIEVDGKKLFVPRSSTYIILNKPAGVVTTASDEFDRKTVLDLVSRLGVRVFPVGRLDMDAEGLLLLTNDGPLAAALMHPAGEVSKVYRVKVRGKPTEEAIVQLLTGVVLEDGLARALQAHRISIAGPKVSHQNSWLELTISEGRNHIVKRMLASIGHPVIRLRRIQMANLVLNRLPLGEWRKVGKEEQRKLKAIARDAATLRDRSRSQGRRDHRGGEPAT